MADVVHQLFATEKALDKLGARGISMSEAEQLLRNRHASSGTYEATQTADSGQRVGCSSASQTANGRSPSGSETIEPTTWLLITAWDATAVERRLIERV